MIDRIDSLRSAALVEIEQAGSEIELHRVRGAYLGDGGHVTAILQGLRDLDPTERAGVGRAANLLKKELTDAIAARQVLLLDSASAVPAHFDVTRPGASVLQGGLHPITQMMYDLNDAFASLAFEVYDGPQISSEHYEFDCLNFPVDHPARESMDTYWLEGCDDAEGAQRLCMRPHLTGGSVRYMQEREPPFRFVYPGRVFRNETPDASHERAFFQYEALIIERSLPFTAGRLLVNTVLQAVFGREVPTRMRAGFFPFVEPGFEIDMQCLVCAGGGCSVCKRVGWLEIMPGGPPHPNVLRAAGLDASEWEGFYINIGLDRLVMMRYGVGDVRLFHSGDLRFLSQFQ